MSLEQWEINAGLTPEVKKDVFEKVKAIFAEVLGHTASYFDINCEMADLGLDDGVFNLSVEIRNKPEYLEPNNIFFDVQWSEAEGSKLMLGEDGDIEWELTPENLWSLMYCQAYCKPE
ncbi:hypothetical protein [Photobacterium atrarenae]|uniref:Uncharacterized protein n=1 Tax=Photobacterium atrarenae TaxID=865757 RepID=A0ABY5GB84_9GAMM|nr:hypothetical protein [Photobacterium atrarenae]UTV26416.1 hypothetical protein NNL38_08475 [Photobacterium atrarenae]